VYGKGRSVAASALLLALFTQRRGKYAFCELHLDGVLRSLQSVHIAQVTVKICRSADVPLPVTLKIDRVLHNAGPTGRTSLQAVGRNLTDRT
jgi:hypothetical protein